jgi:4-hydroxybenzoate polyprenyltransferase
MRRWKELDSVSSKERSLLIPSLVYLGATILIGIPAIIASLSVLTHLSSVVLNTVGIEQIPPVGGILLLAVSVLIGLQLAVEAAAVQLGGIEALGRGSSRATLARYGFLTLCVFIALAAVTWVGLSAVVGGYGWSIIILGLLVGCAGFIALYRSTHAFLTGFRGSEV